MQEASGIPSSSKNRLAIILIVGLVSIDLGVLLNWTPGVATLCLLIFPICTAALLGTKKLAWVASISACVFAMVSAIYAHFLTGELLRLSIPLVSSMIFCLITKLMLEYRDHQRVAYQKLQQESEQQAAVYLQEIAELKGEEADSEWTKNSQLNAEDSFDFALLLLTMQDLGQRISTNLEWETLFPTIISTAKTVLKCRSCEVYLWNQRENRLWHPLEKNGKAEELTTVPAHDHPLIRKVLEERLLVTRHQVLEERNLSAQLSHDEIPHAMAPLTVGGELLGVLIVDEVEDASPNLLRMLYILANISSLAIKNAQLFERIRIMALHDGLTGLLNHASFQEELQRLAVAAREPQSSQNRSSQNQASLTVIMSDLDHFKKLNDTFGHPAGDYALREIAKLWKALLPEGTVMARYGGEEFICALPGVALERGRELAELLRTTINELPLNYEAKELKVTASFGVAELGPPPASAEELIRRVDRALYKAKHRGRNLVVCSSGHLPNSESSIETSTTTSSK